MNKINFVRIVSVLFVAISSFQYIGFVNATEPPCSNGAVDAPSCMQCPSGQSMVNGVCSNIAIEPPCSNGAVDAPSCMQCPSGQSMVNGMCSNITLFSGISHNTNGSYTNIIWNRSDTSGYTDIYIKYDGQIDFTKIVTVGGDQSNFMFQPSSYPLTIKLVPIDGDFLPTGPDSLYIIATGIISSSNIFIVQYPNGNTNQANAGENYWMHYAIMNSGVTMVSGAKLRITLASGILSYPTNINGCNNLVFSGGALECELDDLLPCIYENGHSNSCNINYSEIGWSGGTNPNLTGNKNYYGSFVVNVILPEEQVNSYDDSYAGAIGVRGRFVDLAINNVGFANPVYSGDTQTISSHISNRGNQTASGVNFYASLPPQMENVNVTGCSNIVISGNNLSCTLGDIESYDSIWGFGSRTVTISGITHTTQNVSVGAIIAVEATGVEESNVYNNSSTVGFEVLPTEQALYHYISRVDNVNLMNIPTNEQNIRGLQASLYNNGGAGSTVVLLGVSNVSGSICASSGDISAIQNNLNNIRLLYNGTDLPVGKMYFNDSLGCYVEFGGPGEFAIGANTFDVYFDTKSSAMPGSIVKFIINTGSFAPQNIVGAANGGSLIIKRPGLDNIAITNPTSLQRELVSNPDFSAMKFSMRANNVRDLQLKSFNLTIPFISNGVNNGYVTEADLYLSGSRIATESFSNTTGLLFNGLNIVIPRAESAILEIKVRTSSGSWTDGSGNIKFRATNFDIVDEKGYPIYGSTGYTGATLLDTMFNAIDLIKIDGNLIDVVDSAFVRGQVASSLATTIIPASNDGTGTKIGTFQLKTDYGSAVVQEFSIANFSGTATSTNCTSAVNCADLNQTSDGIVVGVHNNGIQLGHAQIINGIAYITLNSGIIINHLSNTNFDIYVKGGNSYIDGANTNIRLRLGVLPVGQIIGLSNGASAQTLINSTDQIVQLQSDYQSWKFNPHYVRATTLTFSDAVGPYGQNNLIGIMGNPGAVLFKTNVNADVSRSVNLHKITFTHAYQGVTINNYQLRINGTQLYGTDVICTPGLNKVSCIFAGTYAYGYPFGAGQSSTIELLGNVSNNIAGGYIITRLEEGSRDFSKTTAFGADNNSTVVRSDNADPVLTLNSSDRFTDAGIEKLSSNAWTYTREGGTCNNGALIYPDCNTCAPGMILSGGNCVAATCANGATNYPLCDVCNSGNILSGNVCISTVNTGTVNTGTVNTGTVNTGTVNTGTVNTGTVNTGTVNTGTVNTGTVNTGTVNTGTVSTGSTGQTTPIYVAPAGGGGPAGGWSNVSLRGIEKGTNINTVTLTSVVSSIISSPIDSVPGSLQGIVIRILEPIDRNFRKSLDSKKSAVNSKVIKKPMVKRVIKKTTKKPYAIQIFKK